MAAARRKRRSSLADLPADWPVRVEVLQLLHELEDLVCQPWQDAPSVEALRDDLRKTVPTWRKSETK